jgi:BASS family bile acid:Na+ symporter
MFEFFKSIIPYVTPIFVISTMLNVGLTQKPPDIIEHWKNYPFVLKMLIANFVAAPLVMVLMLYFAPFEPTLKAGLLIYSLCAGAPFLIKLTQMAEQKVSLGAAVMMLLMVVTVAYVPVVLPRILSGLMVDAWAIAKILGLQMLLPIVVGMLVKQLVPDFTRKVQPRIGLLGNIALYVLIGATLIGYAANMLDIVGTGAVLVGLVFVVAAFGIGYLTGTGKDHLEDIGGLGTAQRNTAAAMIIAVQNFSDYPDVLVMITLANTLGILMLMFIAKRLSRDNEITTRTA